MANTKYKGDLEEWYENLWKEKEKKYHVNTETKPEHTKDTKKPKPTQTDNDDIGCLWYIIGAIIGGVIIAYNGLGDAIGVVFGF